MVWKHVEDEGPLWLKSEAAGGLGFLPTDHWERRSDQGGQIKKKKKFELFRQDLKIFFVSFASVKFQILLNF